MKYRTISNITKKPYILLGHALHQASVICHLKRIPVAHSVFNTVSFSPKISHFDLPF